MNSRPACPVIYEINTWVWLSELSRRHGRTVTLDTVPAAEWDGLADLGIDAVWLMGVWQRSPAGAHIALRHEAIVEDLKAALPDFSPEDNVGSPYCIRDYTVDSHLGGPQGLAGARRRLAERNIALFLDFVPNHAAPDHAWVSEHPHFFIQGDTDDLRNDADAFLSIGHAVFARARDPYFPAWPDVLQLNAFHRGVRGALMETATAIAGQCDGVRCDMAMLVMNAVFARTWGPRAGPAPPEEFWPELIGAVRRRHPGFLFLAEAYWDLEWPLQQQGFDYCYDKRLYDRLQQGSAEGVRLHLQAEQTFQDRLVRFIENHDEPRAAVAFPGQKGFAAAVLMATVPGARLFHEGQFEGRKTRLPAFLGRRPQEPADPEAARFYRRLLEILKNDCFRNGRWRLCETAAPAGPSGAEAIMAWQWDFGSQRRLVIVNFSEHPAQGAVRLPPDGPHGGLWADLFTAEAHDARETLFPAALPAWGFRLMKWTETPAAENKQQPP